MNIKYLDLQKVTAMYSDEIHHALNRVTDAGWYLQGEANRLFERHYADYHQASCCVGCANGLDALTLTLRAYIEMGVMQPGDEVIVPANTYIATLLAITENGLRAVLVEPNATDFQLDESLLPSVLTARTRAVMLVNLYGCSAYTPAIGSFCERHHLKLIVDNAQGHGLQHIHPSLLPPPSRSTLCHSFYPGKNLGALGDGGAVTTDDEELATLIRSLANYGSSRKYVFDYCGRNSRLDELQAAVLDVKLRHLDEDNDRRRQIALRFIRGISNPAVTVPSEDYWHKSVFHIFPLLCTRRDELSAYLTSKGIQTLIHYPIPPHHQRCYQGSSLLVLPPSGLPVTEQIHQNEISLPCSQILSTEEADYIIEAVNRFV